MADAAIFQTLVWSPDGAKFSYDTAYYGPFGKYVEQIRIINADGSNDVKLSNSLYEERNPAWLSENPTVLPPPTMSINNVNVTEGNAGNASAVFTVSLSTASSNNITVDYEASSLNAPNTPASSDDYQPVAGKLTFNPGATTQTITVPITGDSLDEDDESFLVALKNPSNVTIESGKDKGVGVILDDDATPTLSIKDVELVEGTGTTPTTALIQIELSAFSGKEVTVNYATANDTAQAGSDYTASSGTLIIPPGQSSKLLLLQITGDALDENDEEFFINLTDAANATISDSQAVCGIGDDDLPPFVNINDASKAEGNSGAQNVAFVVNLSATSGKTVTVDFATIEGIAIANSDYTAASGTLTFNPGETSKGINVSIKGDTDFEPDETFFVSLTNLQNLIAGDTLAQGTIINDDAAPTPTPTPVPTPVATPTPSPTPTPSATPSPTPTSTPTPSPTPSPVPTPSVKAEIKTWKQGSNTYAYLLLTFPDSGYRVTDWGQLNHSGTDYSTDSAIQRLSGPYAQALMTTVQIFDLGALPAGNYSFTFKSMGEVLATHSFTVTDAAPEPNPIDNQREFVRWQYKDFLGREPDQAGWDFWTENITLCLDAARRPAGMSIEACIDRQRTTTSAAFFLSPEFQYTGYFVYRVYKGALGRAPYLSEFTPDQAIVGQGIIVNGQFQASIINQNKVLFANQFVERAEFKAIYDTLTNQQYVDRLFQTTAVTPTQAERDALAAGLNNQTETRASVLLKVVDGVTIISEGNQQFNTAYGQAFYNQQVNNAFVLMEYFGYMHRDPDGPGYAFWLGKLNQYGSYIDAEMVRSFLVSPEYRSRFGQP